MCAFMMWPNLEVKMRMQVLGIKENTTKLIICISTLGFGIITWDLVIDISIN